MADGYLGEIRLFAYSKAPQDWLPCNGQTLAITKYQALFSLLGNSYGGDGKQSFKLPDLRGATLMGEGQYQVPETKATIPYTVGESGGQEGVALTVAQMPLHTHGVVADNSPGVSPLVNGNYFGVAALTRPYTAPNQLVPLNDGIVSPSGGGAAHSNMQPYLAVGFYICTNGYYPPQD